MQKDQTQKEILIGSYSDGVKKASIFVFKPQEQSAVPAIAAINPSYIISTKTHIYFVSEHTKGQLITLNHQFDPLHVIGTNGDDPCHISINQKQTMIVVTNYSSGSFMVYGLDQGIPSIGKFFVTHQGSSTNPDRQLSPHPHCSLFAKEGNVLFVTDLGTDVLYYYDISENDIEVAKQKSIKMEGSGPRTICHGPKEDKTLLLSCQLDSTIRLMSYKDGPLTCVAAYRISSNPNNYPSQIVFFNGQVYLACRGDDYMVIFNYTHSSLSEKFRFKVGHYPRHFQTAGNQIYVACQKQGKVYRFLRDGQKIFQTSQIPIPNASCVSLLP